MSNFVCPNSDDFYAPYVNGPDDVRVEHYDMPFLQLLYKDKRPSFVFMLYAVSYLKCAKSIRTYHKRNFHYVLYSYSVAIPCLYNCRHAVELAIKAYLRHNNIKFKKRHTFESLWTLTGISNSDVSNFLTIFSDLDADGVSLRYPDMNVDKSHMWVNLDLLLTTTERFIDYISDLINIRI